MDAIDVIVIIIGLAYAAVLTAQLLLTRKKE